MSDERFTAVIIDDAPDVRRIVRLELEHSGRFVVVGEGSTGRAAVELATRHSPSLLLLDISMPDLDGLEALPAVVAASPDTRVVILSGFAAGPLQARALELGASAYIEKSAALSELPTRLLRLLATDDTSEVLPSIDRPKPIDGNLTEAVLQTSVGEDPSVAFAEHLERFRTVFDQAAIGMSTLTLSGTIVRANDALARLLGKTSEDLVGRPYVEMASPADQPAVRAAITRAALPDVPDRTGESHEVEHGLVTETEPRWAKSIFGAVRDSTGRPLYLFAQIEDVTRDRQALEELRASEERFRLMVDSVQDYAIFMLDTDGRVATWNLGAERLKGYRAEEIIGRHFRVFYPKEVAGARHPEEELSVAVRNGTYEEEGWRVRKDGSRFWGNVVITALFDTDRNLIGFAKVTRDMTERRQNASELEAANRQLAVSARQTEEFVAVTAHELQSPVLVITSTADLLLQYWDQLDSNERRESLERVQAGGLRIRRLLTDLLTASRLDAGSFQLAIQPVNLDYVVAQAVKEAALTDPHVNIDGVTGHAVLADSERLVQILTNLLTNADKYGKPPIVVDARPAGDMVEVAVRDHGDGVPEDLVPGLFTKFSRRGIAKGGVGLGLYITRELARLQGGDARYERTPGQTSFVVSLPAGEVASGG